MIRVVIIGAGLAGLTCARSLLAASSSCHVTVFDKSRGVGGRMATRRANPYSFDHGAQFFKVRHPQFAAMVQTMVQAGVVQRWDARFVEIQNTRITQSRQWGRADSHYVGTPSMNAVAKYLAQDLSIVLTTRVATMQRVGDGWQLLDDTGNNLGNFDWVVIAVPAQQAHELLPCESGLRQQTATIAMQGCFSLMLGFEATHDWGFDAACVRGHDISWVSINSSKPERNQATCMVIHATNAWADTHIDDDLATTQQYLLQHSSEVLGVDLTTAQHQALHRWRYANIAKRQGAPFLLDSDNHLGVCGDWCKQGRVEAAFISGLQLAEAMLAN